MSEAIAAMLFDEVKGSMTSNDGQTVFLNAETINGDNLMLGFPHKTIGTIIENLAVQSPNGRNNDGDRVTTAFFVSGYEIGEGPKGEPVLVLPLGGEAKINFRAVPGNRRITGRAFGEPSDEELKLRSAALPG